MALSTTSVAVVYAVMVETGLNRHDIGKLILAACFVTDLGTVLALGGLFAQLRVAAARSSSPDDGATLFVPPPCSLRTLDQRGRSSGERAGGQVHLRCALLALGGLATAAGSEAVLPA